MKKIISGYCISGLGKVVITIFTAILLCSSAFAAEPWDGTVGTLPEPVENVYTITRPEQLAAVAQVMDKLTNLLASYDTSSSSPPSEEYITLNNQYEQFRGKTFVLANDIDLNNCEWTPIGTMWYPFPGTFDGQGHSITGLNINKISLRDNPSFNMFVLGLFGVVSGGDVKNIEVSGKIGVNIVDPSVSYVHIGGVAADVTDGDVIACVSNVKITFGAYEEATSGADFVVGGVSAYVAKDSGTIYKCTNKGSITCTSEHEIISAGGVVATTNSNMDNCKNVGDIEIAISAPDEAVVTLRNGCGLVGGIAASVANNTISRCVNQALPP